MLFYASSVEHNLSDITKTVLTVGAESVSNFVLRDCSEPYCRINLNFWWRNEERMVTRINGVQAPECEPEPTVRVEAEGHVTWGI